MFQSKYYCTEINNEFNHSNYNVIKVKNFNWPFAELH